jgi:hypothetical protein
MLYDKQKHVEEVIKKFENVFYPIEKKSDLEKQLQSLKGKRGKFYFKGFPQTIPWLKETLFGEDLLEHDIKCLEERIEEFDDGLLKMEPFIDEEIRKREIGNIVSNLEQI